MEKGTPSPTVSPRTRPHPEVLDTKFDDGEMVLFHPESTICYSLNATGVRIWEGLKKGLNLKEISRNLQEEFDVDGERADRSVLELINDLSQQKLVQILE